jgi:hypothetical protein
MLRHFAFFPQIDVQRLKWHFIHPLTKYWGLGKTYIEGSWARNGNNEVAPLK